MSSAADLLNPTPVLAHEGATPETAAVLAPPTDTPPEQTVGDTGVAPTRFVVPGDDATAEQIEAFYQAMGRPSNAADYHLPVPEGDDGEFAQVAAHWMHKAGLAPWQAKVLAAEYNAAQAQAQADRARQAEAQAKSDEAALRQTWGAKYDANVELGRRVARQFGFTAAELSALESVSGFRGLLERMAALGQGLAEHPAEGLTAPAGGAGAPRDIAKMLYPELS